MTDTMTESVQQLTERITDWRSPTIEVDAKSRWIRNIALAGRESRNGYQYSQEALTEAVQLYEHKPVFLDHAERLTKPFERSTRDLVGSIVNARFEGDRIRGDIRVLDTEAGRTFLALAEAEQTPVGMSHVVLARRSNDRTQVEAIEEVVSVDAVMYPATTQTFHETTHQIDEELKSLQHERDELLEELQQTKHAFATLREQQSRESERLQLLAESGLPEFAMTAEFREQILKEEDPQRCRAFIEERRQLLRHASARRPSSRARRGTEDAVDDRAIVNAIRGRRQSGIVGVK